VEEDSPGTRDLVVVCGDATIATSTLLLAAAFPWVREVMEEVGEETALSLPSLTSSLLTTFLHSCVSGPWREEFTPILTLLTPGGLQGPKAHQPVAVYAATDETSYESESFLSAAILNDSDTKSLSIEVNEVNEHAGKKKKTKDLFVDWDSDDEGDLDEELSKEPEIKSFIRVVSGVENCNNDIVNGGSKGSLGFLGPEKDAIAADSDVQMPAERTVDVLKRIKIQNEESDIKRPHKCTTCTKRFTQKHSLKEHMENIHTKMTIIAATAKSLMEKYGVTSDDIEKPHKCTMCEERYALRRHLNVHMEHIHNRIKTAKCAKCEKCFKRKSNLNVHMKRIHNKIIPSKHKKIVTQHPPSTRQFYSYICPHCGKDFNKVEETTKSFQRHLRYCLVEQFTCICFKYIPPKSKVNPTVEAVLKLKTKYQHMVEEHREPIYWCDLPRAMDPPTDRKDLPHCFMMNCYKTFPSLEDLRGHREEGKVQGRGGRTVTRSYICSGCGKDFTLDPQRSRTFRVHQGYCRVEQFSCDCPGVPSVAPGEAKSKGAQSKEFKKKLHHMQIVHMGQFGCLESSECYKTFETNELLDEHIKEMHKKPSENRPESFSCEECGQQFNKYTSGHCLEDFEKHKRCHNIVNFSCDCPNILRITMENIVMERGISKPALTKERHMLEHHQGWLGCKKCIKSFETDEELRKHESFHESSFMCTTCGIEKIHQQSLDRHIKEYHEAQSVVCEICRKVCQSEARLTCHMKSHNQIAKECDLCGKLFKKLKHHKKVMHVTDKPFKCLSCDKSFVNVFGLNIHTENMHTKSQPHACRYGCDKRYNDASNRKQHEKRRHPEYF